jgi:hypothetical protein
MEAIEFEQMNTTFAKNQPEYLRLPAHKVQETEGRVVSCWKGSWKDRLLFLFIGKLWLTTMTFNHPLQPILLQTEFPFEQENKKERGSKWLRKYLVRQGARES